MLTELPLALGVLLGWVAAWWRGKAFVLDGLPHGYGWFDYLNNAWMIVHRQQVGYNNFREPLHAWMVGTVGEAVGSYPDGAALVASAGVFGVCVGVGLFGRALVGPWTGALCAAAVPWTAHAADMARWANYYGVAGCLAGACLGLGALAWLRPHPALAAATGLLAGLTWGVDPRTMTVAVGGVCLVLLGLTRAGPRWKARLLALVLLGAGLALGPWSHDLLWLTEVADPPWQQRVSFQGPVVARWISRKAELAAVCSDYPRLSLRDLATGSCGQTLLRHNLEVVLPRHLHFGLPATLAGLLLCLLPGRQGWRGSLAGLSLWSGALGLLLLCLTMPLPDRYAAAYLPLFVLAAPVGLGRLVNTALPRRLAPWGLALAMLALGTWAYRADPAARSETTQLERSPQRARELAAIELVTETLGPEDLYRDCSPYLVAAALLPRLTQPEPPVLRLEGKDQCASWIAAPVPEVGTRWVSLDPSAPLPDREGARIQDARVDLEGLLAQDGRWTRVEDLEGFQLWRQGGGSGGP